MDKNSQLAIASMELTIANPYSVFALQWLAVARPSSVVNLCLRETPLEGLLMCVQT